LSYRTIADALGLDAMPFRSEEVVRFLHETVRLLFAADPRIQTAAAIARAVGRKPHARTGR
jgi:hypothetical protein